MGQGAASHSPFENFSTVHEQGSLTAGSGMRDESRASVSKHT
jgi:hypothetical protein